MSTCRTVAWSEIECTQRVLLALSTATPAGGLTDHSYLLFTYHRCTSLELAKDCAEPMLELLQLPYVRDN